MKIDIKKYKDKKINKIVIEGNEIENSYFSPSGTIELSDTDASQKLIKLTPEELIKIFEPFCVLEHVYLTPLKLESKVDVNLKLDFNQEKKSYQLQFSVEPDYQRWDNSFLVVEYMENFSEESLSENVLVSLDKYDFFKVGELPAFIQREKKIVYEGGFKIREGSVKDNIQEFLDAFERINSKVYKDLSKNNSVIASFDFPKEVRTFCEQYLLYFAQFLQDLGIDANSNLKEEAGRVLFSVTPTDDVEALDKIREALAIYLNLPSSPIIYDESFAAMRLKQQVDNLQHAQRMTEMEFRLAQKVIESQDKIIQQKDSTIEQQSKVIEMITDKAVMINSAENKEELEEIFDGIKVGKSKFLAEQIGLHLNPATALKSVGKKLIGREDEIISLNLNDEMENNNIIER